MIAESSLPALSPRRPARDLAPPLAPEVVADVIAVHRGTPGHLLGILEDLQKRHRHQYLPKETLIQVARLCGIALSQVYSVATFYAFFSLEPQGDHAVTICRGTACHARGSKRLLECTMRRMGIQADDDEEGELPFMTTEDRQFTIRTVACFGQCALAPVAAIDETIHGGVTEDQLSRLVHECEQQGADR
jgi:NADH-quinone oxidoreductase subunit E